MSSGSPDETTFEAATILVGGKDGDRAALHGLAEVALEITAASTVDAVLRLVARAARDIVRTHQAVASRVEHGAWGDATSHVLLSDKYAEYRDYERVPRGLGVIGWVVRENRPLRLTSEELRRHPEWRDLRDAPGHPPLPDYLAAPLVGRDGANLGAIQLSDKVSGQEFSPEDEAILVQLAQMASHAVQSIESLARERQARLDAEEQGIRLLREKQRAEALETVGRAIAARLDLHDIVQQATDAATELTPAQFGAFFYNVIDDRGEAYMLYTISGVPREAFERFPMPRNTAIFGPTFAGEGLVRIDDVTADPRYGRNAPYKGMPKGHLPVRSYLAVPVTTSDGNVAGGLFFGHPERGMFSEDDEHMVEGIANQAAIAIENARLYRDAQDLHRRQAVEINDNILQALAVAGYALDQGATDDASAAFVRAIDEARKMVGEHLNAGRPEAAEVRPGDLRRREPAPTPSTTQQRA